MSCAGDFVSIRPVPPRRLAQQLRILSVIAQIEFKMKYADSALGYAWSLAKPLSYFGVLYLVFGHLFRTGIDNFPIYLLIGIVLYTFFTDAVGLMLPAIATRGAILRRMSFEPLIIPLSVSITACITFGVNLVAVGVFLGVSRITPDPGWLLIPLLLAELYLFILGVGLLLTTLFVRFRDIGPMWELVAQLLIFASPIMYPISILPTLAQQILFLNPFVQVVQDVRYLVLGASGSDETIAGVLGGSLSRAAPLAVALGVFVLGFALFRRDAPRFAERV